MRLRIPTAPVKARIRPGCEDGCGAFLMSARDVGEGEDVAAEGDGVEVAVAEPVGAVAEGDGAGEVQAAGERTNGSVGVDAPDLAGAVGGDVEPAGWVDGHPVEDGGGAELRRRAEMSP